MRAVVETAHRLEALSEADHGRAAEHGDPLDNAHGGDGGIPIGADGPVQADGGEGGKALPRKGGEAAPDNHGEIVPFQLDPRDMDLEIPAPGAAHQQQAKADKLTEDGGPGRPGHPHIEDEDQQGVQGDVQHRTAGDAHHTVDGTSLETQLVIEHQRGGHPGGAQEDHPEVGRGVRQNSVRRSQEIGQGLQKDLPQDTQN